MSVLALIYIAINPLLAKRYSEKGRYYVWLVIVIGLIIPFRLQWSNAIITVEVPNEIRLPIIQMGNETHAVNEMTLTTLSPAETVALPSAISNISWWNIAAVIWIAGLIIFLTFHLTRHYCFVKTAKRWSETITDNQLHDILQILKSEMGISKKISIYQCASIGTPMMIGFIKPKILLPKTNLTHNELRFILKHELVHYKRKDLYFKCCVLVATAIHWFNPILYIIAKAIETQCELSCDTEVVLDTDADTRQHYSETIIGVMKYQSRLKTALSTNFYGGKKGMKKRIFSIMDTGKKKAGFAFFCAALIVTFATGFVFAADTNIIPVSGLPNENTVHFTTSSQITNEQRATQLAAQFEGYNEYGLAYDQATGNLYFNNEIVRYFMDRIYISTEIGAFEITYFDENGMVDVYTVRTHYSETTYRPDGARDLYSTLLTLERVSQAEFDARDIESIKNQPHANDNRAPSPPIENIVNFSTQTQAGPNAMPILPIENNGNTVFVNNHGTAILTFAMLFEGIENFGLTFDGNFLNGGMLNNIYYQGQLVRTLNDDSAGRWLSSSDTSGNINIRVIRNDNGNIIDVEVVTN